MTIAPIGYLGSYDIGLMLTLILAGTAIWMLAFITLRVQIPRGGVCLPRADR